MLVDLAQGRICRRQVHIGPGVAKGHGASRLIVVLPRSLRNKRPAEEAREGFIAVRLFSAPDRSEAERAGWQAGRVWLRSCP